MDEYKILKLLKEHGFNWINIIYNEMEISVNGYYNSRIPRERFLKFSWLPVCSEKHKEITDIYTIIYESLYDNNYYEIFFTKEQFNNKLNEILQEIKGHNNGDNN